MPVDKYTGLGIAGGLLVVATAMSNLWPLVPQAEGRQTMLHATTAWALLPVGLLLALRDAGVAGVMQASKILGTHFRSAEDLVETPSRFMVFLVWAGLSAFSGFGGLWGSLAGLLCLARAATVMPAVHEFVEKLAQRAKQELEQRGVNIPGFTDPPKPAAHKD